MRSGMCLKKTKLQKANNKWKETPRQETNTTLIPQDWFPQNGYEAWKANSAKLNNMIDSITNDQ